MQTYKLFLSNRFIHSFKKIDKHNALILAKWIEKNLNACTNPYFQGIYLRGKFEGCWRYRIGNYRLIVKIEHDKLIIIAIEIAHRRDIYTK